MLTVASWNFTGITPFESVQKKFLQKLFYQFLWISTEKSFGVYSRLFSGISFFFWNISRWNNTFKWFYHETSLHSIALFESSQKRNKCMNFSKVFKKISWNTAIRSSGHPRDLRYPNRHFCNSHATVSTISKRIFGEIQGGMHGGIFVEEFLEKLPKNLKRNHWRNSWWNSN